LDNPKFTAQGKGYIALMTKESKTSFDTDSLEQRTFESLPRALVGDESRDLTPGGTERIAIAEDDVFIRRTIQCHLMALGYKVEAFANGGEFLAVISEARPPFAVLLTDHEMPGLTGYELARRIRTDHSQVRVLLMSGCPKDSIFPDEEPKDWPPFLRKPYTLETLARRLRDVIDGPAPEQQ
jgi:CheY-like chemotaxis protein